MKFLIIADSHGNIANLKHVMGFAKRIGADAVIHCGDWNDIAAVRTVLSYKTPLFSILGNADIDPEVGKTLSDKSNKFNRVFLEFEVNKRRIGVVHNFKHLASGCGNTDILFCGHNHWQKEVIKDNIRIVNPGALENKISFAIYDSVSNGVEFMRT